MLTRRVRQVFVWFGGQGDVSLKWILAGVGKARGFDCIGVRAEALGISIRTASRDLSVLVARGTLMPDGQLGRVAGYVSFDINWFAKTAGQRRQNPMVNNRTTV